MGREYPYNRFIDAKIRQTLQILRDQGCIEFLGRGKYRRLDAAPVFSLLIDPTTSQRYRSESKVTQHDLETWAELNLYCLSCPTDSLVALPPNAPIADFRCPACDRRYQLKGTKGKFADLIPGAAYRPVIEAVRSKQLPDYVLVEYDRRYSSVWFVRAIAGLAIDEARIKPRNPLRPTARRAGWVGCMINVGGLPSITIVEPQANNRANVRTQWAMMNSGKGMT
jgi:type II restriction enzyme